MTPPRTGRPRQPRRPHGQIRQSQVVTTFGPGAMVDLPDHAVIIAGLEQWQGYQKQPIQEERLAEKVKKLLGWTSVEFFAPPGDDDDPRGTTTGVTAWLFPEWFVAQEDQVDKATGVRSRPLVPLRDLGPGRKYRRDRNAPWARVVPIRFVQACTRGHVSDIDWRVFVHGKGSDCTRALWLDERGTTGDLTDIDVRCECGQFKALAAATKFGDVPLGYCNGPRPWLGNYSRERCGGPAGKHQVNRLLIRSASNAYFAQTLSVISIPEPDEALRKAVDEVWVQYLQNCESLADVAYERRRAQVVAALQGFTDAQVWVEVQRRKDGGAEVPLGIREAEFRTLMQAPDSAGQDQPEGTFYARSMEIPGGEPVLTRDVERIVKIHRLREVIAQVGFTRFEAAVPDVNGELALDVERAALSLDQKWLPAVENRGEGIFIGFRSEAIDAWQNRPGAKARRRQLEAGFQAWCTQHGITSATFPGVPYVMLHTLAHLLNTAVALECGYAASSIRERIYVAKEGCGILLYTATADAEGTLGGLVQAADHMDRYLRQALEIGRLCSNDPVCAHHQPDHPQDERRLLGAACHGCVLLAESACERRNDFLDRALVVPTVDAADAAFFDVD